MSKNIILVQSRTRTQKIKALFVPTALALFLSACTGSFFENPVTETLKNEAYSTSEFYINQANQTTKEEDQQTYRLLAVRKLLEENKLVEAQNTFAEITPKLNEVQLLEYQLVSAQLAAYQNNNQQANAQLKTLPMAQLSQSQAVRYYQTFAKIAENQKDTIEAVRARSAMNRYLTDNRSRQENNDKIWEMLRNANKGMLAKVQPQAGETELAGWIALINSYNQHISQPAQLPQSLSQWKQQYPNHSAVAVLPTELQNVASFQQTQNNNIALLLPLSGEGKILGDIIKRGFTDAKGDDATLVQTYDTDSDSVTNLVAQAKQQGAQAIVGPLLKPRVDELLASPEVNGINILALNSTPNVRAIAQVCYYGLSPEAEAKSAADRLYRDGIAQAIVAAPQNDFGQRSADAFSQRWLQLTNNDADVRYFNQPLDAVSAIQNNAQGQGIYLLGTAEQVLEMKQGIDNSELAGKFKIYTSSRSHSPNNGIDFFQSMEGVKFSEIPMLADVESETYKKALSLSGGDYSMMRLYAMGSDAWGLANKFNEFRQIPGYSLSGLTGTLSAGTNCNIERGMSWLQYSGGTIVPAQ